MSDIRAELESMRALLAPGGAWYGCGEEYLRNAMSARLALLVDMNMPTSEPSGFVICPLCHDPERVEDMVGGVCLTCADAIAFSQNARRGAVIVPEPSESQP